ncbi:hypothetical protein TrLO_g715 [Triparma laevis f. longispina]|uniref:PH domain-containing protein n=1 Tax=Triparma laevis f. longispina TaxID=1714387 RepID=A0A9W7FPL2_9STRA|nr:hypothetical protein TrLO_g715 [Triparma laevis f. longispina]
MKNANAPPPSQKADMQKIKPFSDPTTPKYLLQGTIEKETVSGSGSVGGLNALTGGYKRRFFRLTKTSLTYYTKVQSCSYGFVPLDERGCIPINLITRLDVGGGGGYFEVWVTNAENCRYPGRNHGKKDPEFARVYKLKAMDEEVKETWCSMLKDVMDGKYRTIEDMQRRGGGFGEEEKKEGEEGEKEYKTNLTRLLKMGDDWDELKLMSEEEMLRIKAEQLAKQCNAVTKKYKVKGKLQPGAGMPPPAPNEHKPNEANSMKEKRHMTVVTEAPGGGDTVEEGDAKPGAGGCGCVVS